MEQKSNGLDALEDRELFGKAQKILVSKTSPKLLTKKYLEQFMLRYNWALTEMHKTGEVLGQLLSEDEELARKFLTLRGFAADQVEAEILRMREGRKIHEEAMAAHEKAQATATVGTEEPIMADAKEEGSL